MSSKFFTNRDNNTLENRLKDILTHYKGITHLEFLIGYFRISGFSKIATLLKDITNGRILVGINIDKLTLEAKEAGVKLNLMDFEKMSGRFVEEQLEGLGKESYSQEVDESVILFAQMLAEKKIEIRISPEKNIHSKIYILREDEIKKHDGSIDYRGSVITGSSNLSENGLTKNFEFNVELRDSDDIGFALEEFNNLWAGAVEITEKDVESIKAKSHLKEVTPYELYKKEEELREDCRSLHTEPLHQGAELPRQAVVQKGLSTFRNSFTSISLADDGLKEICTAYRFCGGWR